MIELFRDMWADIAFRMMTLTGTVAQRKVSRIYHGFLWKFDKEQKCDMLRIPLWMNLAARKGRYWFGSNP